MKIILENAFHKKPNNTGVILSCRILDSNTILESGQVLVIGGENIVIEDVKYSSSQSSVVNITISKEEHRKISKIKLFSLYGSEIEILR